MREDWVECKLSELSIFEIGGDWGKDESFQDEDFTEVYCIRGSEFRNWNTEKGKTASLRKIKKSSFVKRKLLLNDILVEISGGGPDQPVGRVELIDKGVLNNFVDKNLVFTNFLRLIRPSLSVNSQYVVFYLKFFYSTGEIIKYQAGSNNLRNLKFDKFLGIEISLPPLPEQRAIVKKIETLFSSLDNGIADLKKAQLQLKIFRQAVLKKAFEGIKDKQKVSDIAFVETGATPKRGNLRYWENGTIPWITSGALNNEFVKDYSEQITETAIKETNCKIIPQGSLLIAMYGEGKTRGKCSELTFDATTNQAVAAIILKEEFKSSKPFLKWFFIKNYNDIRLLSSGGVQPNLNLSIIKNTEIPLPSLEEQHQIVKEIEARLSVCDAVEAQIKESLEKAEALRQSILKKAFEGKLLTAEEIQFCKQEPGYEPASVLLERIKAEQKVKSNAKK